jgi:uncharacterized protein
LSLRRWSVVLAVTVVGFAFFVSAPLFLQGAAGQWLSIIVFVGAPLIGLRLVAGRDWIRLFHQPTWRDVGLGLAFVPAALAVSAAVAIALSSVSETASNPVVEMLAHSPIRQTAAYMASVPLQLLGEELITVVVLLAATAALLRMGASRRASITGGWLISAVVFGALHLPTYQWNVLQAILVIGSSRLMLTLPYLWTRNLWVSTITHVTLDGSLIAFTLLAVAASGQ